MTTVPAQIFCAPRAELIAAARSIPGVCAVLLSRRSLLMTLTPSTRQSGFRDSGIQAPLIYYILYPPRPQRPLRVFDYSDERRAMDNFEFAILGAGAIGSIIGAHLARSGQAVVMLARG